MRPDEIGPAERQVSNPEPASESERPAVDTSRSGAAQDSVPDLRQASAATRPPEMFGRYRILNPLGQGAMGAVFLAEDTQLRRRVALKIPNFTSGSEQSLLDRFYREARAAAALRHPYICPVHDVGEINGRHYLTMAFIEGKPLSAIIKSARPLSEKQIAGVIRNIALGLKEAHAHGVVHRDLKPANIMIDRKGEPVVTDFGLARQLAGNDESRITQIGAILGTPAYMSPEQVEGGPEGAGPLSDVYSLGVILYELLTGRPPFQGPVISVLAQIASRSPPGPSELREGIDPTLEAICLRAMARKAEDRYSSMGELAEALTEFLQTKKRSSSSMNLPEIGPAGESAEQQDSISIRLSGAESKGIELTTLQDASPETNRRSRMPRTAWAGAGALVLLAIVIFAKTPTGTIRIELSDPAASAEVRVDGETVSLTGLAEPLHLKAAEHELVVTGATFETVTKKFTVRKGENPVLHISLEVKPASAASTSDGSSPPVRSAPEPLSDSVDRSPPASTSKEMLASSGSPTPKRTASARSPEPDRPASSPVAPKADWPRNRWIKLEPPADLKKLTWLKDPRYENGVLEFYNDAGGIGFPQVPAMADAVIRAKVKILSGTRNIGLGLRQGPEGLYYAWYNVDGRFGIGWSDGRGGKMVGLGRSDHTRRFDDFFELAFSAIGSKLTVTANGETMLEVTDSRARTGTPGLNAFGTRAQFKEIEIKLLDDSAGPGGGKAASGPAAAEWLGPVRILQRKTSEWKKSGTDYARSKNTEMEVGMGTETPGWGWGICGLEIENVRRISFTLATSGKFKKLDDASFAGFKVDYRTPAGYTKRVAFSTWSQVPTKPLKLPDWGQSGLPNETVNLGSKNAYDIDLERWAPPDWDGNVWFTLMVHNTGNGSSLQIHSLRFERRK